LYLCVASRSASLKMATVRMPSSVPARKVRTAISPRLAHMILLMAPALDRRMVLSAELAGMSTDSAAGSEIAPARTSLPAPSARITAARARDGDRTARAWNLAAADTAAGRPCALRKASVDALDAAGTDLTRVTTRAFAGTIADTADMRCETWWLVPEIAFSVQQRPNQIPFPRRAEGVSEC
jgi:hypothetical protein